jgi:hypothetical protein
MASAAREKARRLAAAGASVQQIKNKTGLSGSATRNVVSNWAPSAASPPPPDNNPPPDPTVTFNDSVYSSTGKYPFQWQFEHEIGLTNLQGGYATQVANIQAGATTQSASIRAEADKEVAKAYADAQKYGAELGLEGIKYGSDKEAQWREAVANIEVKGKLDLQPIINAGLERVAGISAQAQRDVAETTGKYSLESMKERTAADKSIGKMQLAGSMYGLIGSMFG